MKNSGIFSGYADRGRHPWLMLLPPLLLLFLLLRLLVWESLYGVPIPIKPLDGAVTDTDLYLFWNPVEGEEVTYDVEVGTSPAFGDLLYRWSGLTENKVKRRSAFAGGETRYWRVRAVLAGRPGGWSRSVPFRPRAVSPSPRELGLAITSVRLIPGGLEVQGNSLLPEGTAYYLHLIREQDGRSIYRQRRRCDSGRFRAVLKTELEAGKSYLIRAATYPFQGYPAGEILGPLGRSLPDLSLASGRVLPGLGAQVEIAPSRPVGERFPPRRRFSDYFLDLTAQASPDGVILLGRTNLPDGVRLGGALARIPGGAVAFSNAIPVADGRFSVIIKPRPGEAGPDREPYRVAVFFDPALGDSTSPALDGERFPRSGGNAAFSLVADYSLDSGELDRAGEGKID